ncbi:hypothetical protein FKP32DRAFT_1607895 [Trametes sanguinea]|nr:hypothetical protein FKP32DRAFT_1607895 [Trametes sanguinea]
MSSADPGRPRVITLTADQLLGTSLTPVRAPKSQRNTSNGSRVLTIEDLLGPGLRVAQPSPKHHTPKSNLPYSSFRSFSSTRTVHSSPNPHLVRVTADEVLRTGIPVRTLQAVKARSGQARILTAEELLAAGSSRSLGRRPVQSGNGGRATALEQQAGPSGTSRAARSAGSSAAQAVGSPSAATGTSRASRSTREDAASGARTGATPQTRNSRPRRSVSLGSMRTLPIYTQEPGESEVVIDRHPSLAGPPYRSHRGAAELEDDDAVPITVISPVEENEPNADGAAANIDAAPGPDTPASPGSPTQTSGITLSRQLSPADGASSSVASSLPPPTHIPPWVAVYGEAAPSHLPTHTFTISFSGAGAPYAS